MRPIRTTRRTVVRYTPAGDSVTIYLDTELPVEHAALVEPARTPGRFPFGAAAGAGLLGEQAAQRELPRTAIPTPIAAYVAPRETLPSTATIPPCACAQSVGGAR